MHQNMHQQENGLSLGGAILRLSLLESCGAGRGGRTPTTLRSADFESAASASSAIPAWVTKSILNEVMPMQCCHPITFSNSLWFVAVTAHVQRRLGMLCTVSSRTGYLCAAAMLSRARFNSSTFTRGSPRNPNCLGSIVVFTSCST